MLQLFPEANLSKPSPEIVDTFPLINSPLAELKVIAWESSSVCALPNVTLASPVTWYLPLIGHTLPMTLLTFIVGNRNSVPTVGLNSISFVPTIPTVTANVLMMELSSTHSARSTVSRQSLNVAEVALPLLPSLIKPPLMVSVEQVISMPSPVSFPPVIAIGAALIASVPNFRLPPTDHTSAAEAEATATALNAYTVTRHSSTILKRLIVIELLHSNLIARPDMLLFKAGTV
jgi:hypothetical protein